MRWLAVTILAVPITVAADPEPPPPPSRTSVTLGFGEGTLTGGDVTDDSTGAMITFQAGARVAPGLHLLFSGADLHFTRDRRHPDQRQDHDAYTLAVRWSPTGDARAGKIAFHVRTGIGYAHLSRRRFEDSGERDHDEFGVALDLGVGLLIHGTGFAFGAEAADVVAFHDAGPRHAAAVLAVVQFDLGPLFGGSGPPPVSRRPVAARNR